MQLLQYKFEIHLQLYKLFTTQKKALHIISNSLTYCQTSPICKNPGILHVHQLTPYHALTFMFQQQNNEYQFITKMNITPIILLIPNLLDHSVSHNVFLNIPLLPRVLIYGIWSHLKINSSPAKTNAKHLSSNTGLTTNKYSVT